MEMFTHSRPVSACTVLLAGFGLAACADSTGVPPEAVPDPTGASVPIIPNMRPVSERVLVRVAPVLETGETGGEPRALALRPVAMQRKEVQVTPMLAP